MDDNDFRFDISYTTQLINETLDQIAEGEEEKAKDDHRNKALQLISVIASVVAAVASVISLILQIAP